MQLDRRAIENALPKKGFAEDRSGHHRYFHHQFGGRRSGIYTYTSHGSAKYKTYGDPLLSSMCRQLRLDSRGQLVDLVKCPMSGDGYNNHLRSKGLLAEPEQGAQATPKQKQTGKASKRRRHR